MDAICQLNILHDYGKGVDCVLSGFAKHTSESGFCLHGYDKCKSRYTEFATFHIQHVSPVVIYIYIK